MSITHLKNWNLDEADQARKFIDQFPWGTPTKPTYVELSSGRTVHFADMSDEDAKVVARAIYYMLDDAGMVKHR